MEDLSFERRAPTPLRFLHPGLWSLLLILVPAVGIGIAVASGALNWVEANLPGVPRSALIGSLLAAIFLPAIAAGALPLLWRKRYGSCHLRGDVLTFEPGGISIPRDEIKGWRRHARGLSLDSTLHPDRAILRPLLIPVEGEEELARALRWLEATQPEPKEAESSGGQSEAGPGETPQAEAPVVEPLVKLETSDQVFTLVSALALIAAVPLWGGIRFGWEAVSICFGLGAILSSVSSGIVYFCLTRHFLRVLVTERALLVGRRRVPYEELSSLAIEERALAYVHTSAEGKQRRAWIVLPEGRGAELRSALEERLSPESRPWLSSTLPSWARRTPRRGLARTLIVGLLLGGLGLLSAPQSVYGRALAPFGIFNEVHLRDDDGHVLTLLYSPGSERPRFAYFASEGIMGGIAGYEVTLPGVLGGTSYGLRLGSGGRQVNVAEGRIQDGAYRRALDLESRAALRFGDGDWRTTSEPLPAALTALALKLDEVPKLESLPAALEPLLEDPSCPELVRDFVTGRTSWRVHEATDAKGERLVALVLQGRVRTLALLPAGQPYGVEFAVIAGKTVFFRSLSHGMQGGQTPGLPVLSKKEDSQVCWIGAQGWSRAPIGNLNLDELLEALESTRGARASAREALRELLGAAYPAGLDAAPPR